MKSIELLAAAALVTALPGAARAAQPTAQEARDFIEKAESRLEKLNGRTNMANWVQENFITYDTEKLAADANELFASEAARLARESLRFEGLTLPADTKRKFLLLKLWVTAPAPPDPKERKELALIEASLSADYGKGRYCRAPGSCMNLQDISERMRLSRDPKELLELWQGWHDVSAPLRTRYARLVELSNKGARKLGFKDTGVLWRSGYDMTPEQFSAEVDRLYGQLKPLYESLHAYVRRRLVETYGRDALGADGLIPAHLLGNMWAQEWTNIDSLVSPNKAGPGYDLTSILQERKMDPRAMVSAGEHFFVSLGLAPLPATFWERSLFAEPRDREVDRHASAWDVENSYDLRVKMCILPTADNFTSIHHELGHNFYQRAYAGQPFLFRGSANDGFHEALGDTIALSVTPDYLVQLGYLAKAPGSEGDLGLLMDKALDRVAAIPFGLLIDQWRWGVFSGEIPPAKYNQAWWELRRKYQGVKPPVARSERDFDPGAVYHVPANEPYTRYFLANVLEFQFYRALCRQSGYQGPLHRCSYFNDKKAGAKLKTMMEMGASRPWPEALEAVTGTRQMDATAILDYFAPLKAWLDEQNRDQTVGWR